MSHAIHHAPIHQLTTIHASTPAHPLLSVLISSPLKPIAPLTRTSFSASPCPLSALSSAPSTCVRQNYEELAVLHNRFAARGFQVLAFPCNQFGNQEPRSNSDILSFARTNHSAPFRIFAKTLVNAPLECSGTEAACSASTTRCCPSNSLVFDLLKQHFPGDIEWNFAKFLVGKDGITIRRYAPTVNPLDIAPHIEAALAAPTPRSHAHSWWGFGDGKDEGHADVL
ncbi:unnamed protein product [Closterium sp. Naga37s-1]|nr:unnamed protein product [Closterium sp. Naga37s-1]